MNDPGIEIGSTVLHRKFGLGRVTAVDRNRVTANFSVFGQRTIIDSFLTAIAPSQMQTLAHQVDRVTRADRLFFERHPNRRHRVRLTSRAELEQWAAFGERVWGPDGYRIFTVVRSFSPDLRLRLFIRAPADFDTDITEAEVASLYVLAETPRAREIAAAMSCAAAERERRARP